MSSHEIIALLWRIIQLIDINTNTMMLKSVKFYFKILSVASCQATVSECDLKVSGGVVWGLLGQLFSNIWGGGRELKVEIHLVVFVFLLLSWLELYYRTDCQLF